MPVPLTRKQSCHYMYCISLLWKGCMLFVHKQSKQLFACFALKKIITALFSVDSECTLCSQSCSTHFFLLNSGNSAYKRMQHLYFLVYAFAPAKVCFCFFKRSFFYLIFWELGLAWEPVKPNDTLFVSKNEGAGYNVGVVPKCICIYACIHRHFAFVHTQLCASLSMCVYESYWCVLAGRKMPVFKNSSAECSENN